MRALWIGVMLLAGCSPGDQDPPLFRDAKQVVQTKLGQGNGTQFSKISKCGMAPMVSGDVGLLATDGGTARFRGFVVSEGKAVIEGEPEFAALIARCDAAIDAEGKHFKDAP